MFMWTCLWLIGWMLNGKIQCSRPWSPGLSIRKYRTWSIFGETMQTLRSVWPSFKNRKKLTFYQGALYHHDTLASKLERVMWFIVPMAHCVTAMNGCHRDPRHQGQQQMLYLLQDWFWWSGMATKMQKVISNCEWCIQHGSTCGKEPMQPIVPTAPLELLHIDFMCIEMTMELDQSPNMVSVLVFCDHFMKHVMAYVTPYQTGKTNVKFLWQGYILICGAMAKLLSNQGTILKATSSKSFVNSWAYGRLGLHLTMLKPMDKLSKLIKHLCTW